MTDLVESTNRRKIRLMGDFSLLAPSALWVQIHISDPVCLGVVFRDKAEAKSSTLLQE